jgi:hypothetical protein
MKPRKKKPRKFTLKRAAQKLGKFIYQHVVKLPEEERERNIATIERAIRKKFGRQKRKKPKRR